MVVLGLLGPRPLVVSGGSGVNFEKSCPFEVRTCNMLGLKHEGKWRSCLQLLWVRKGIFVYYRLGYYVVGPR